MSTFKVVGIGASAGGLRAIRSVLRSMRETDQLAVVVLQHLKPDVRSYMVELLARDSELPVLAVEQDGSLDPGTVYVCPPGLTVTMTAEGSFDVRERQHDELPYRPIDGLFQSLAMHYGPRAVGVVLSGTGNDGSAGVREIAGAGGLTLAQTPASAEFEDMPRNAASTGFVDVVAAPSDMASHIDSSFGDTLGDERAVTRLINQLDSSLGVDLSGYKRATFERRIARRVEALGLESVAEYVAHTSAHHEELHELLHAVLIGVTSFFRDADAWTSFETEVQSVLESMPPGSTVRAWSAGCSTGEEAYTLAMVLKRRVSSLRSSLDIQVFGTDLSQVAIDRAGLGRFEAEDLVSLEPEEHQRYFRAEHAGYRVRQGLRGRVVFAQHDLLRDPPFGRLDVVSCRNLLIYLDADAQRRALERLAYALKPGGLLFLGASESADPLRSHLRPLDSKHKIYRKEGEGPPLRAERRSPLRRSPTSNRGHPPPRHHLDSVYRAVAETLSVCVLVLDEQDMVVYSAGPLHKVAQLPSGVASFSVLDLLRPPLSVVAATLLQHRERSERRVESATLRGAGVGFLQLSKARSASPSVGNWVLTIGLTQDDPRASTETLVIQDESETVAGLRDQLAHTQQNLQASNEELVASNQELQATNEELIASNEELQATNEELHSVNEELHTVNAEYAQKLRELEEANNDLDNVIDACELGVVFLDENLRIRRFTGHAERWLDLLPQDLGRRFDQFMLPLLGTQISRRVHSALEHGESECFVSPDGGHTVRVVPYVPEGNEAGVIVAMSDATGLFDRIRFRTHAFDAIPYAIAVLDMHGVIVEVNEAWREFAARNGGSPHNYVGDNYLAACNPEDDPDAERSVDELTALIDGSKETAQHVYPCHSPTQERWFLMHGASLEGELGVVVAHIEITSLIREIRDD